jgi:hypothetical protein
MVMFKSVGESKTLHDEKATKSRGTVRLNLKNEIVEECS